MSQRLWTISLVLAALVGVGCGSRDRTPEVEHERRTMHPRSYPSKTETRSVPDIGLEVTSEVGVSMISVSRIVMAPALSIEGSRRQVIQHGGDRIAIDLVVPASGLLPQVGEDPGGGRFYSSGVGLFSYQQRNGSFRSDHTAPAGVFLGNDGRAYVYWHWPDYPLHVAPLNGTRVEHVDHVPGPNNAVRRELVYTGISGATVSLLYREFLNDLARPAFSQELRYDLGQSKTIGYQGARFDVVRADNTSITYRVLSHLPLPGK